MAKQDPSPPDPEQTETTVSFNGGPAVPLDEFERRTKEAIGMATGTAEGQQLTFKVWAGGRPPNRNGDGPEKVEAAMVGISGKILNGFDGAAINGGRELYMDEQVTVQVLSITGEVLAQTIGTVESVTVKRQKDDGRTILVREQKVKV